MKAVAEKMCTNYLDPSSRKKMIMEIELLMPQKLVKSLIAEILRGGKSDKPSYCRLHMSAPTRSKRN